MKYQDIEDNTEVVDYNNLETGDAVIMIDPNMTYDGDHVFQVFIHPTPELHPLRDYIMRRFIKLHTYKKIKKII